VKLRLLVLLAVTALVVTLSYVGFDGGAGARRSTPVATSTAVDATGMAYSQHELARLITAFEHDVHRAPNATGLSFLGGLYLQRARLTGDLGSYEQAGTALADALRRAPTDAETLGREASYRYRTHDFAGALDLATRVTTADPSALGALAVLGDAQVELGRDDDAVLTYQRLAAAAPQTPSVDVRRSHLAFVTGDVPTAARFAARAEQEAVASGEFGVGLAYYREARAQLRFDQGDYDGAAKLYEQALRDAPGYYATTALLAKARAAQGRFSDAIRLYRKAIAHVPQPDYLAALGDLLAVTGQRRAAEEQYRTVELTGTLAAINRQVYNRQLALFDADHGRHVADAVRMATAELEVRKDGFGYDTAAWALLAAGRVAEARADSDRALATGVPDARVAYHAGMIAKAQGDVARARRLLSLALHRSPHFDVLQARRARQALAALR
jgi:tetratricopeptide (TPR) repeat protein